MRRAPAIALLCAITAASVAAVFAISAIERAGWPVGTPGLTRAFSPDDDGSIDEALLVFHLARAGHTTVTVRDGSGKTIRTLERNAAHDAGRVEVRWDGRTEGGDLADEGEYDVVIRLHERRRSFPLPRPVSLDLTPPRIQRVTPDLSMLARWRVIARVEVHGATTRHLEVDGRRLETMLTWRTLEERRRGRWVEFVISARLPDTTEADRRLARTFSELTFVATDDAGNESRRTVAVATGVERPETADDGSDQERRR